MSYGQLAAGFGLAPYAGSSNYYVFYRSKSLVSTTTAGSAITRGGVALAPSGTGVNLVNLLESRWVLYLLRDACAWGTWGHWGMGV
jgi:hypothetical protein